MSGPGRRGHNKTQVRLAGQSLLRHIPPNYSLKRTVQSLRDWSCRLAQALGTCKPYSPACSQPRQLEQSSRLWRRTRPIVVSPGTSALITPEFGHRSSRHLARSQALPARSPDSSGAVSTLRLEIRCLRGWASGLERGLSPRSVCFSQRFFSAWATPCFVAGNLCLTVRSSGQINRFAIDAAA